MNGKMCWRIKVIKNKGFVWDFFVPSLLVFIEIEIVIIS